MELFKLFGTIALNGVDETHSALDGITDKASGIGSKIASGVGTVAKTVGKTAVAAVAATTTAVAAIGKTAVQSYAEYEQLVGGVDTLFKDSSKKVQGYADNAYKTAGMSANQYMDTVTSFSASLLQGLAGDTEAAANMADMAITDMADNANKMGTDISMIQNAYQGFAKQNFTMLDNLKLGYGGTKTEMERLLRTAEELEGYVAGAFDINNFADVVEAIHIIQEEMGIAGTTAKEAASTISGSLSSVRASWSNLLTGMSQDDADMSQLISNFTSSIETAADNLLPRITETISGIGEAATQLAPFLVESVSKLIKDVAPDLLEAGAELANTLLESFAKSLGDISPMLEPIGEMILNVKESIANIFSTIGESVDWDSVFSGMQGALEVACGLIEDIVGGFEQLVTYATTEGTALNDFFVGIQEAASQVVSWFQENWGSLEDTFNGVKEKLASAAENIIGAFNNIVTALTEDNGLKEALNGLFEVINPLVEAFGEIVSVGGSIAGIIGDIIAALVRVTRDDSTALGKAVDWFRNELATAFENLKESIEVVANFLNGDLVGAFSAVKTIGENVADSWKEKFETVKEVVQSIIDAVSNFSIDGLVTKVQEAASTVASTVSGWVSDVKDAWNNSSADNEGGGGKTDGGGAGRNKSTGNTKPKAVSALDKVETYASGGVLKEPTAFALNPYTGKTMIGGEAGPEAIAPIDVLQSYVSEAVEAKTSGMNDTLNRILDALVMMNDNMGASMREAMEGVSLRMNNRELARAVKGVV